ncbi:hypothetical protein MMC10_006505 [Thelotrema lepadinum]|nr:hypothetical protein [Thelotrema lepadinum]
MFHARLFGETAKFRSRHFQPLRSPLDEVPIFGAQEELSSTYLDGRPDVDRPLTVQFCANDATELLQAATYVQPFCDAIDLNLGCPQGIAKKGNYGAFLQEDWDLVCKLISTLDKGLDVPVTAKIRILETKEKTLAYAKRILESGASILTVHGRQRDQKGHKTGLADWSVIRYLRDNLPPDTVLFANGNILRSDDIDRCLTATGADGVMSAEGNLYDPTIFADHPPESKDDRAYWQGRDGRGGYRMDFVFRRYLSIIYKYVLESQEPNRTPLFSPSTIVPHTDSDSDSSDCTLDEQPPTKRQKQEQKGKDARSEKCTEANLTAMQPHLFHLLRPLVSVHTEVRDALARSRAGDMAAFENVLTLTEEAVKQGLIEYKTNPEKYEESSVDQQPNNSTEIEDITDYESSLRAVQSCKRPWWVCQPYVRPLPQEAFAKGSMTLSKKEKKRLAKEEPNTVDSPSTKRMEPAIRLDQDIRDGLDKGEAASPAMVCG